MSPRSRSTAPRALMITVAFLAVFGFAMSRASVAIAQEASPVAGECEAPALPPGSPTPMEASPVAMPPMAEAASPVAEEAAPVGTPADQAVADEATAAIMNLINCINSANYEAVVALFTSNGLLTQFGTTNPYDVLAGGFLEGFMIVGAQISDVETYADGRVSAQVDFMSSQYQANTERWFLLEEEGFWKLDQIEVLTPQPEGDTAVVGVTMGGEAGEYTFAPNVTEIAQSEVIVLHGINAGAEPHEMVVVRLPEDVTSEDVINANEAQMGQWEQESEFLGFAFFEPGQQADLALVGVGPGTYTIICFITSPEGVPHFAMGMVTQITVTEPVPAAPVASPAA